MLFNDLLREGDFDPKDVIVFRHRPKEPRLRDVLPWLVEENHDLFNAYQQTQTPRVEKAMLRAKFVASFIGHEPGKALFVGLYGIKGTKTLSFEDFWSMPSYVKLNEEYGMRGMVDKSGTILWFDLARLSFRHEWKGRLVISWPGKEVSWMRWANRNDFQIHAITEEAIFSSRMPHWRRLTLSWSQLNLLPRQWRESLSRWRGVYYVFDESDGTGYVGAAYGKDNLYQRWKGYAKSGHGGNKKMKGRNPERFRFSILQIVQDDTPRDEVQSLEADWKCRLHTIEFGMNDR